MNPPDSTDRTPANQVHLIGHSEAENSLALAAKSGRLAHAWLFCGPEGIGKATLAYRFARHVLDGSTVHVADVLDGPSQDPASRVFRLVAADAHPDLLVVRRPDAVENGSRASKRPQDLPIEQIRKIPSFLSLSASDGGWRVVIVDEADRLNRNSANALLKVLEEPPDRTLLMLITEMPGRLMPTIRSRCRRLTLSRLSDEQLEKWLDDWGFDVAENDRKALVTLANGSPGRLFRLIENDALSTATQIRAIFSHSGRLDWAAVHKLSEFLARPNADAHFDLSVQLLTDRLETAIQQNARGLEQRDGLFTGMSGATQLDRLLQVWDKARDLFAATNYANLDKRAVLIQFFAALEGAAKAR